MGGLASAHEQPQQTPSRRTRRIRRTPCRCDTTSGVSAAVRAPPDSARRGGAMRRGMMANTRHHNRHALPRATLAKSKCVCGTEAMPRPLPVHNPAARQPHPTPFALGHTMASPNAAPRAQPHHARKRCNHEVALRCTASCRPCAGGPPRAPQAHSSSRDARRAACARTRVCALSLSLSLSLSHTRTHVRTHTRV